MLAKDVVIDGRYKAKVSNVVVTVQIMRTHRFGGWVALNEATGREVRIKTASRLREAVSTPKGNNRAPLRRTRDEYKSRVKNNPMPKGDKRKVTYSEPAPRVEVHQDTRTQKAAYTARGREALAKVTAHFLNEEKDGLTLADALDQAIMYLGDFIYNGAESGMQDEVDQVIGRLSDFRHNGKQ